jgi:hypothetical protein
MSERYPGLEIFYNGAGKGIDPPEAAGGMIEGFCLASWFKGGSAERFAPPDIWAEQMGQALLMAGNGRGVLLLARHDATDDARARLYALASFHLARGERTRFSYMTAACGSRPLPEWDVALGAPLERFLDLSDARQGGDESQLYRRRFERGQVWVNGDRARTRTIALERPGLLVELRGEGADTVVIDALVERLELGPQSGAIVVWPSAGD